MECETLIKLETSKQCSKCKEIKFFSEFKKHKLHLGGLNSQCKKCVSEYRKRPDVKEKTNVWQRLRNTRPHVQEYNKKYRLEYRSSERGKERIRDYFLKRDYGITIEQFNIMYHEQNGKCAICSVHQSELNKSLHVDHDHITGKVRKLLCHHCNTAIGAFDDNIELLEKAKNYLLEYK